MKKIIFLTVVLLQAVTLFSQASKEDYLKKSKKQKTVGTILLAGGGAFVVAGFLYPRGESDFNLAVYNAKQTYPNDGIKIGLAVTGAAFMLSSIPFYIASGKNKRNAEAISINIHNQKIYFPQQGNLMVKSQPAVRVRMGL